MKKSYIIQKLISVVLVMALVVGVVPTSVLAAEEPQVEDVPVLVKDADPMLGIQSGVEPVQQEMPCQPRSLEELMALDCVVLSEDGTPVAVQASEEDHISMEELKLLFGGSATMTAALDEPDPNRELREQFGLTDAQIEKGTDLHGSRLAYTSELSDLTVRAEGMELTQEQVTTLAELISWGYTCPWATRALVSKELFGFSLDELKTAQAAEIEATRTETELKSAEGDEVEYLSGKLGLPQSLAEKVLETSGKGIQTLAQEMPAAMEAVYPTQIGDNQVSLMAATANGTTYYAPEEVLSQPYSYDQQGNFNVNLNTGAYSYAETDLTIPGKNGLDFVLTRQFHSDRASVMETRGCISDGTKGDALKVYYRWYELEKTDNGYEIFQELTDHRLYTTSCETAVRSAQFVLNNYQKAVEKKEQFAREDGVICAVWDRRNGGQHVIMLAAAITTINTLFEDNTYNIEEEDNFYVDQFGLGHGWMLGLSHLRWVQRGYGDMDDPQTQLQLTLSDGTRYGIANGVSEAGTWIENYDDVDIMFRKCEVNEYPNAVYGLYHKDGKVEYFNRKGQNIAIRDRFGNTITIDYTMSEEQVKKIQITDTMGNLVVYEEIPLDESVSHYLEREPYNKLWRLSLNGSMVREYYSYRRDWSMYPGAIVHPTILSCVRNAADEVTCYGHWTQNVRYNSFMQPSTRRGSATGALYADDVYANDGYNVLVAMYVVKCPNGGRDYVSVSTNNIQQFGGNGYRYYSCCNGVSPLNSAYLDFGMPSICYSYGDFDGLEGRTAWKRGYHTKVAYQQSYYILDRYGYATSDFETLTNYELTYTFNLSGRNTKVTKRSYSAMPFQQAGFTEYNVISKEDQTSWISQTTEYSYPDRNPARPSIIKTVYTDATSGEQLTQKEQYEYDNRGNVLKYIRPDGQEVSYTYDDTYSVLKEVSLNQNDATIITTTNTLSEDKKSILSTEVKSNDDLVSKTVYRYDSYGQLIAQDDYRDATNYVTTTYAYDYTTGSLPIQTAVSGVNTADGAAATGTPGFSAGTVAVEQSHNKRGWLMSETDANGNTTSYTYDSVGRLTGAALPNGTSVSYSYDVPNNAVTYTDQAGNRWKCTYGKSGKLLSASTYPSNQTLQLNTYDQYDRLVKEELRDIGQVTYYRYDTDGNLIERTIGGNTMYRELYTYEQGIGKVTKTVVGDANAPSVVTTSYQNNMGNTVKTGIVRNGVEELTEFAYDYLGNQTQVKTAFSVAKGGSYTTASTYNHAGQLLTVSDANGNTSAKTYDWLGNQLTEVAPKNNTNNDKTKYKTTYTYDALGRLLRVESPIASGHAGQTNYTYDPNGNVVQERTLTGAKGDTVSARSTTYTYDNMNRLTQVRGNAKKDGQNGTDQYQYTNYTYDALGNIASMSVSGGSGATQTTHYAYDRYSHLTQSKDALGQIETYTYDRNGNLTKKIDRRGVKSYNTYDAMGRLTKSVVGKDSLTFTYTKTGQRRTASSNDQTTTYTYNDAGDLIQEATPVATKTMTYGIGGVRNTFTVTANGKTYLNNQYTYNKLGQLTKVNSLNVEAHYSYDSNGNLANVTNGNGTTASYTYNKAGLVTEIKNKTHSSVDLSNFKYTYGADGNQLTKTDSRGSQTSYTYDGLNCLTQETQTGTGAFINAYTYDNFGNRQSLTADGVTTNYTYDANNRLLSGGNAFYTYDAQGNMTQSVLTFGNTTQTVNCTYDGFNRLQKASDSSGETMYTYDADGLRTSKTTDDGTEHYVWDGDQLVVTIVPEAECLYSGTIPSSGTAEIPAGLSLGQIYFVEINGTVYRAEATMEEAPDLPAMLSETPEIPVPPDSEEPPAHFDAFVYLQVGDVVISSVDGGDTGTVEGSAGTTVKLYNNDPRRLTASYVCGLSLIASVTANGPTYYHYNAHGDVVQTTTAYGGVIHDYTYDAFGVEQNPDGNDTNPFRYCGEQYDSETGNYYLRARYYVPGTGRFTQEDTHWNPGNMVYGDDPQKWNEYQSWLDESERDDPLGLHTYTYKPEATAVAQAGNLYGYCLENPVLYRDASGKIAITTAIFIGALVGAAIGGYVGAKVSEHKHGEIRWQYVAGGAVIGAVVGGFIGYGLHSVLGVSATNGVSARMATKGLARLSAKNMSHILADKHAWGLVTPKVTPNAVKTIIKAAILYGQTNLIGQSDIGAPIFESLYGVDGETVKVTYTIINNALRISNAWVITR